MLARGDLLENLEGEGQLMPSPELTAPVIRPAKEPIATARPAVFLPVVREGFGRGNVSRDGKDEGEGTPGITVPIAIEFRRPLTERRGLDIIGQFRNADVGGDGVHGGTSFNNVICRFCGASFQLASARVYGPSFQLAPRVYTQGEGARPGGRARGRERAGEHAGRRGAGLVTIS